ncbi:MAG: hypothetical protein MZW92_16235 [Comamonadaceae bacterium]|nr:hypothetical protein [Comamonadaceae bacterium]
MFRCSPGSRARARCDLSVRDGRVEHVRAQDLRAAALLREAAATGATTREVPDIVARICGICPVAYQMSAVHALEAMLAASSAGPLGAGDAAPAVLRRVDREPRACTSTCCTAPDFLGYPRCRRRWRGSIATICAAACSSRALGNDIIRLVGGRSVHPGRHLASAASTGAPAAAEVSKLRSRLHDALPLAEELVQWAASLALPHSSQRLHLRGGAPCGRISPQ